MKMNDETYRTLMLRYAKELDEIGVTENMRKIIEAQIARHPNVSAATADDTTAHFVYRHQGYKIEAKCTVTLVVKTCK